MAEVNSNVLKREVNVVSETLDVQPNNKNKNGANLRKKVEKSESQISEKEANGMNETSASSLEKETIPINESSAQLSDEKTNAMREMSDSTEEAKAINGISDSTKGAKAINGISDSTKGAKAINGISDSTEEAKAINGVSDSTKGAKAINGISDSTKGAKAINGISDSTEEAKVINDILDSTEVSNAINGISDSTEEANAINSISDSTNESNAIFSISDSTNEANGINGTSEGAISINGTSTLHLKEDTDTSVNETSSQILEKANVITETSAPLLEEEASATTETPVPVIGEGLNIISETSASLLEEEENMTETSATLLKDETNAVNKASSPLLENANATTEILVTDLENEGHVFNGNSAELLPEETTAINEEEANAISETWTVLWSNKKENGIALFIKLFTTYPEAQKMFKEFDGLTIEEVRSNKKLRAHALSLMYALKSFLDNLDDPETLEGLVRKNAINHATRGVGPKEIMWLLPLFLELLDEIMEGNVTKLQKKAWTKLYGVLASISREEVNNLSEKSAQLLTEETTAITEEEANVISETWTVLWSNKKENGIALFVKLFTTYPEAQKMFKEFDGLTIEEVRSNKKLKAHALALMYALKSFLDNLDDPESLEGLVRKNAINHAKRGVGPNEIMWLLPLFLELLDEILEENATELLKKAWTKLFGVLASISLEEVNNLKEEHA
ncbi:uncharacterized protein LOC127720016 [Mytilus californianus]|uniref:uncharacterized protein LOC127720016 n=1 Tax=Mytilus californianus TaxID=6549 RepID=UPI0022467054|nr:uncharacterized protein LOC127720016 [Mytilus californianus]